MAQIEWWHRGIMVYIHSISFFLGPHLWYVEVPRLWVKLELQLLAYATVTAKPDPSHICQLHCNLWQHWILNPLREVRDRTCVLMDASQFRFCWSMRELQKLSKCLLMVNGLTVVHPYHGILLSNKRNRLLTHTVTWIELQEIMPSEKNQFLNIADCIIPLT